MEKRGLLQCTACRYQASPTAGTVMHRSKMPLKTWFNGAYLVTTLTPGLSAVQFARQVGIDNYETAFTMLHKLRAAMVREGRDRIGGLVEVDETYIGGERAGRVGRGALGKVIVVGAVEVRETARGTAAGRVRLQVIPDVSGASLIGFVQANIVERSTVKTDEWAGYFSLPEVGYLHVVSEKLIHIHRVFSNLKTWIIGTHHGVSPQHLQAYLNEYTYRFNRRGTPMAAFQTVLGLAQGRMGPTYDDLYGMKTGESKWAHPTNPLAESTR
jgi:transposase-like protein